MANKKRTANSEILQRLTDIAARHDKKLAHDYQAIQRLEKDTDKVTKSVGTLSVTVGELSGTVKTQASIVNSVLAVTVVAFLGFMFQSVMRTKQPDPRAIAESMVTVIQAEVNRQTKGGARATADKTANSPRP